MFGSMRKFCPICLLGNTPAQRAYERIGFRIHQERRSEELERMLGTPGTAQLRLDLRAAR